MRNGDRYTMIQLRVSVYKYSQQQYKDISIEQNSSVNPSKHTFIQYRVCVCWYVYETFTAWRMDKNYLQQFMLECTFMDSS